MMFMLMPMLLAATIPIIILLMTISLSVKSKFTSKDREQVSVFECGFSPISGNRIPFSMHYFLIAMLFLIFDMEIVILMPSPLAMMKLQTLQWAFPFSSFLIIVTLGWIHEWNEGSLEWTK